MMPVMEDAGGEMACVVILGDHQVSEEDVQETDGNDLPKCG